MVSRSARPVPSVERRIHFYRADTGHDETGLPIPLDLQGDLRAVHAMAYGPRDQGGRYLTQADGEDLTLWVDDHTPGAQRVRFARLRRNGLPQTESGGTLTPLVLGAGEALSEVVHLVLFPDNIIGAEFNFYGPRPTRWPGYLQRVCGPSATPFRLEQILRQDVLALLQRQEALRMVDLRVRRSYAQTLAEADGSLGAALAAAAAVGDAETVGIVLQADSHRRTDRLARQVLTGVRRLARRNDIRENATRFQVKGVGPEGRVEPLDLLADALVTVRRVPRTSANSRVVESGAAYEAVIDAHREAREAGLLDGAGVSTPDDDT
jgi:hypothetical protein